MPIPPPPPPPGGPPPPPAQSVRSPPSITAGRGALLSDICKGTKLRKVTDARDRSAPQLHHNNHKNHHPTSRHSTHGQPLSPSPQSPSPQSPDSKTPPSEHPYFRLYQYLQQGAPRTSTNGSTHKPKVGGATTGSANGSAATSPVGGVVLPGGATKLRASADGSSVRGPRAAAPRPPSLRQDDTDSLSPSLALPPQSRRGNAPSPPVSAYNRDKPLPPTPPSASKPRPPTSGGNPAPSSLLPPTPHFHGNGAENDPPQRLRGPAPPPPSPAHRHTSPAHQSIRAPTPNKDTPPPNRDTPTRAAAPPAPVTSSPRPGCREAPPPPPGRTHDDFESKYSFHPLADFPPPEEYRHFTKIYPSKANRVMRGAPPLPPVAR